MKYTLKELIKKTVELQEELNDLIAQEQMYYSIEFFEGQNIPKSQYSFDKYTEQIESLIQKIRHYKMLISDANYNVKTTYKDLTINECLIYLAQMSSYLHQRLNTMKVYKQEVSVLLEDGNTKVTRYLFNVEELKKTIKQTKKKINQLQDAIDLANLTHYIDV
ncbi:hypothetical protein [Mycoplasmopsis alligatoris]|uniref:Uncharacterized protein n=1 Tax=Mycoplasmopsis alligatoris A21JP2 TaxID=747682 RepID=D4XVR3_9BACT|nr:hypothetical protein [Mycoplasmopsis alligatoris]EFF41563.1 hypothetical protein MALL_0091 [Mycoplasmopsis alligatoris A21JP2]